MKRFETQDDAVKLILKSWGRRREHGDTGDYYDASDLVIALGALGVIEFPVMVIAADAS